MIATWWKKCLVATAATAAVAVPIAIGVMHAPTLRAQSPAGDARAGAFDVASIKPSAARFGRGTLGSPAPDRFQATGVTVRELVAAAYGWPMPLPIDRLKGGPKWIDSDRFDVIGRIETRRADDDAIDVPPAWLLALRRLLAERFNVLVHTELKEGPVYALVMARTDRRFGPRFRRSELDCAAIAKGGPFSSPVGSQGHPAGPCRVKAFAGRMLGEGGTLLDLAQRLASLPGVGREVLDRTGLAGNFDFDLEWTPPVPRAPDAPDASDRPADAGPSIFTALQEQLGLKLQSTKGPVDVLVIDHIERPSED